MSQKFGLSSKIKPGDDFFHYVNQRWLDAHPIPADKAQYGAFEITAENNLVQLKKLLKAKISPNEVPNIRLVKQFYQAGMNEAAIAATTPGFVAEIVKEISDLADSAAIMDYIARQHGSGRSPLWDLIIEPDDKDSRRYLVRFWQGGLGLPERTYYLEDSEHFQAVRKQYLAYLAKFFKLIGQDQPAKRAKRVYDLELVLAKVSRTAADLRDPERNYNLLTAKQLASRYSAFNWDQYLPAIGLDSAASVSVGQPEFLAEINRLIEKTPVEQWQDYLTIHNLSPLANKLSKPYESLSFNFYGKVLSGVQKLEPRDIRMVRTCMAVLPEPTGQLFVEHFFDEAAKNSVKELVEDLQTAFEARIGKLDWMTAATQKQARHKLSTFLPLLGYPDTWKPYDDLEFGASYAINYLAACRWEWHYHMQRINDPVDRTEWLMSPALVNAYYWPNTNGITFPAGILQPPFFDATGDFAANYGAIGAVIGHEITHGFDDQGSQFDADGNMKSWWQPADRRDFDARTKRLAEQYCQYEVAGRNVDGQLTLGENTADLGGLLMAYDALQHKLAKSKQHAKIDGLTPEQRFFISFAHSWSRKSRDETMLQRMVSDPHSPEIFRVNGVLPNIDAFYEAFDVKDGDKLYIAPDKRVRIW